MCAVANFTFACDAKNAHTNASDARVTYIFRQLSMCCKLTKFQPQIGSRSQRMNSQAKEEESYYFILQSSIEMSSPSRLFDCLPKTIVHG